MDTLYLFSNALEIVVVLGWPCCSMPYPSQQNAFTLALKHVAWWSGKSWKPFCEVERQFHEVKSWTPSKVKRNFLLFIFFGKVLISKWDPSRWAWYENSHFLDFSTKLDMELLTKASPHTCMEVNRWWPGSPLDDYGFRWSNIWDPKCCSEETTFSWSI